MIIGCVKEIKNNEFRVGMTPDNVREYVNAGHSVLIETNAGICRRSKGHLTTCNIRTQGQAAVHAIISRGQRKTFKTARTRVLITVRKIVVRKVERYFHCSITAVMTFSAVIDEKGTIRHTILVFRENNLTFRVD